MATKVAAKKAVEQLDPTVAFLSTLMGLYLEPGLKLRTIEEAVESLPPNEAMVFGMMCLKGVFDASELQLVFAMTYQAFGFEDSKDFVENALMSLAKRGYLKAASKDAQRFFVEHDFDVRELGEEPFIVTAAGAKRIAALVGTLTKKKYPEVVKDIQAKSRDAAAKWEVMRKKIAKMRAEFKPDAEE